MDGHGDLWLLHACQHAARPGLQARFLHCRTLPMTPPIFSAGHSRRYDTVAATAAFFAGPSCA